MNMRIVGQWMVGLLVALWVGWLVPGIAGAQGEPTVTDVAKELYCPLCSGLTVDVCELEVCADMREDIAARLEAGESPDEIRAAFVARYGQKVLGRPSTEGFHLTAWVIPFLALGLAALALWLWLRGRQPAIPATRPAPAPTDDEYRARLERELQRMEE